MEKLLWKKSFWVAEISVGCDEIRGMGICQFTIIYNGKLIIQCDVLENSFVAAYEVKTGNEIWKTQRDEYPDGVLLIFTLCRKKLI